VCQLGDGVSSQSFRNSIIHQFPTTSLLAHPELKVQGQFPPSAVMPPSLWLIWVSGLTQLSLKEWALVVTYEEDPEAFGTLYKVRSTTTSRNRLIPNTLNPLPAQGYWYRVEQIHPRHHSRCSLPGSLRSPILGGTHAARSDHRDRCRVVAPLLRGRRGPHQFPEPRPRAARRREW